MTHKLYLKKLISLFSALALMFCQFAPVQAAMVTNDELLATSPHSTIVQAMNTLERNEVQAQLVALGVDPMMAKERVRQMTNDEIALLESQLEELPAGSGIGGALVAIFLILVITDMLGATDVFTFVDSINTNNK